MSADHIIVNKEPVPALTEQLVKSNVTSPHMGASIRDLELPWWLRQERLPAMQETQLQSQGQEDPLENGNGTPLQYPCLENPMDGGAWQATVHEVAKSWTRLSDFTRGSGTPN